MAVFAQIEKKRLVKKLRAARDRKSVQGGRIEGRKSDEELAELVCFLVSPGGDYFSRLATPPSLPTV